MSSNNKWAATFHPEPGFGDVDIHAAEQVCNCGHLPAFHEPYCLLCRCGAYLPWGTQ